MGGVDLCNMLLSLYRIHIGTKKWYMHLVYYCLGIAIVNAWLVYRRHCKGLPRKKVLQLKEFQVQIAETLLSKGKVPSRNRGRPSFDTPDNKRNIATNPILLNEIRYDKVGHFPVFEKQGRCRYCPKGYSRVICNKCKIRLCLTADRNCLYSSHNE